MDLGLVHDALWRNALGFIPIAIAVALACRLLPLRAATRHLLWTVALLTLMLPPALPNLRAMLPTTTRPAEPAPVRAIEPAVTAPTPVQVDRPRETAAARVEPAPRSVPAPRPRRAAPSERVIRAHAAEREAISSRRDSRPPTPAPAGADRTVAERSPASPVAPRPEPTAASAGPAHPSAPAERVSIWSAAARAAATGVESLWSRVYDPAAARAWAANISAIHDEIVSLPPIPPVVWFGGAGLVTLVLSAQIHRTRRLFGRATPAPAEVQALIDAGAEQIGLRAAPRTYLLHDRVSPMLYCGARPRLILPAQLWDELDDAGRRAVVHHELAHLKRRDHWLRWAELAVACVYWWHPMVWWVRRRLREEADHCCDAWVTALMPADRRAYATALVRTSAYLNRSTQTPGPVGLGVATANARRFARRLTMVMTHRTTPRASLAGLALAGTLAALTAVATPLWACPPEKRAQAKPAPAAAPEPDESTFERFMRQRDRDAPAADECAESDGADSIEARLRNLESRLREALTAVGPMIVAAPAAPRPSDDCAAPDAPAPPAPAAAATLSYAPLAAVAPILVADTDGSLIDRTYTLPPDQLEAFTSLMVRDDVPVLVRPGEGEISVRATAAQHAVVAAFVAMLTQTETQVAYRLSDGKLQALTELMALNSVPVLIRPGDGEITVIGTTLEQEVFSAFGRLIDPEGFGRVDGAQTPAGRGAVTEAPPAPMMQDIRARARAAMVQARALIAEADRLDGLRAELEAQADHFERQAEQTEEQADAIADEAEELLDRAEELADQAESAEDAEARYRLLAQAGELKAQAVSRRMKAEGLALQASAFERQAEVIDAQLDAMEDRADALRDEAEAIEEAIEEEIDALEESLEKSAEEARAIRERQTEQARAVWDRQLREASESTARAAEQIRRVLDQHEQRLTQRVDVQSQARLRQRLDRIDRQAAQRVVVRDASDR